MLMKYRFVGSESHVGQTLMNRFGQRFAMEEPAAVHAQKGGAALLPEEIFQSFEFTDEDLKIWADPFMSLDSIPSDKTQAAAKAAFMVKRAKAQAAFCELRAQLLAEESMEQPTVEMPVLESEE